jgi:DNA-directed RNA polymerase subunit RPC12/RpoP
MIKFRCEHCEKKIGVPDDYAGKQVKCPGCGEVVTVPEPDAVTEESQIDEPVEEEYEQEGGSDSELAALQQMMGGDETPEPLEAESEPELEPVAEPASKEAAAPIVEPPIAEAPPLPPPRRSRSTAPGGHRGRSIDPPDYPLILLAGHLLLMLGVLALIIAIIAFVGYATSDTRMPRGVPFFMHPAIMSGLMFLGIAFYNAVIAQILYAFRHMAINSWYLRHLRDD